MLSCLQAEIHVFNLKGRHLRFSTSVSSDLAVQYYHESNDSLGLQRQLRRQYRPTFPCLLRIAISITYGTLNTLLTHLFDSDWFATGRTSIRWCTMQTSLGFVIYTCRSSNSPYDRGWSVISGRCATYVYGTIFHSTSSRHLPFESLKIDCRLIHFVLLFLNLYILFCEVPVRWFCHFGHFNRY